jgi:hypothetical protein
MSFRYTDRHREEYFARGYTILELLIPPALLGDLRRQAETARKLAREIDGPQAQRLQPVYEHEELDHRPFHDFLELEGMRETVLGILGTEHQPAGLTALLFEPAERPWCNHWHRDWVYNVAGVDPDRFFEHIRDQKVLNQLNGALYQDASLWFVPGSDARRDTEAERAAFPTVPPPPPELAGLTNEEAEVRCVEYARSMPGAVQVTLEPGDVVFYRASAWHLGNYVPHHRRATLHDAFYQPKDRAWREEVEQRQAALSSAGVS